MAGEIAFIKSCFCLSWRIPLEQFHCSILVGSSLITILRLDLFILGLVDQVDVCCGTGSIGLSLAGQVGQVLGLDIVDTAVEAAMSNAMKNNVTNCEFYPGR